MILGQMMKTMIRTGMLRRRGKCQCVTLDNILLKIVDHGYMKEGSISYTTHVCDDPRFFM